MMRHKVVLAFSLSLLAFFVSSSPNLFGQDAGDSSENPAEATTPKEVITPTGERIIYIPFKDLDGAFQNPESNVVLPYAEFKAMLEVWKNHQKEPASPAAIITSSDYVVKIDGEVARVTATLKIKVLGKSWVWQIVDFGEAAVGKISGDNVLARGLGAGRYELFFDSPGDKTVTVEMAVPVSQSPDGRRFVFNTPPVAVSTLDVTVPKKDQAIKVTPTIIELDSAQMDATSEEDVTHLRANIGSTKTVTIQWHPQTSLKPEMNLLSSVTNHTLVTLEDGLIHTDAYLNFEILRGSMSECRIVVPKDHRILDVTASARIKNWETTEAEGNQIVQIEFLSAVEKPVTVEVHTERKLENGQFDVAGWTQGSAALGIHAMDAVRESGQLAIRHSADVNLTIAEQQGVVRIESENVDARLKGANALTYKFYSPELALKLNAKPVEPRLMIGHQIVLTFQDDELQVSNTLQYNVERAGIFELKLALPEDLTVDNVQSPQMKEYNVDTDKNELTVTLNERTQGAIQLVIRSHRELTEDETSQALPLIEPLGAERETGTIFVYAKDAIEVITDQDGLEGAQPLPANQGRTGAVSLNSAWSFSRRPLAISVRTKRKLTRLSAQVGTTVDVQPELTQIQTQLDYLIEYSGVDTFRFEVPESISKEIQIETSPGDQASAPIKQRTASDPVDGWVIWTIETQREVLGRQRFIITYDVTESGGETPAEEGADADEPPADAPSGAQNSLTVQLIRPLGQVNDAGETTNDLANVQGELLVKKERSLSISAEANGGEIELIDLRELKTLPQSGTLAYRYFNAKPNDRPTVKLTQARHDIQEVVSTVISRGLVEIVSGEDAEATYRCRFNVKSTERQRLLVHLPVNLEVLGTFLNDREVKLEKAEVLDSESIGPDWTPFWVNVARTESSEEPFLLTFQFLWRVNPPLGESTFGRGRISLPLPVIGDGESSVAQELKVVVWVPEKYSLVGDPNNFNLKKVRNSNSVLIGEQASRRTDRLDKWVQQGKSFPGGVAQFPTDGRVPYIYTNLGGAQKIKVMWWNHVTMTLIVSIAIALIGWVLLRTSWENKLGMLLIAAFAAALYGLSDSHALSQGMHAARYGLLLLIGLWVVHGLFNLLRSFNSKSVVVTPTAIGAVPATSTEPTSPNESQTTTPEKPEDNSETENNTDPPGSD
ncbi:hypothetical protein [Thalassoglobus sp.]|uniref:hypothetical protein n=1 Tax=Thalassoglobus sp. TaxID=2795869 RepID=UPI003AA9D16A